MKYSIVARFGDKETEVQLSDDVSVNVIFELRYKDGVMYYFQHNLIAMKQNSILPQDLVIRSTDPKGSMQLNDECKFLDFVGKMNRDGILLQVWIEEDGTDT